MIKAISIWDKENQCYLKDDGDNQYVIDLQGNIYNTNSRWNCETDLEDCRLEMLNKERYVVNVIVNINENINRNDVKQKEIKKG